MTFRETDGSSLSLVCLLSAAVIKWEEEYKRGRRQEGKG